MNEGLRSQFKTFDRKKMFQRSIGQGKRLPIRAVQSTTAAWPSEPAAYRLVAELQQLVGQPVDVADEFRQRLFEVDGRLQDLVTAVHPRRVGGLQ